MRVFTSLLLCALIIGCDGGGSQDRGSRRDRRNRKDDTDIVVPVQDNVNTLTFAQKQQAKARADGMRDLASQADNGKLKTVWDASKAFRDVDRKTRETFDSAVAARMEREFGGGNTDNLPSSASKVFNTIADELDKVAK